MEDPNKVQRAAVARALLAIESATLKFIATRAQPDAQQAITQIHAFRHLTGDFPSPVQHVLLGINQLATTTRDDVIKATLGAFQSFRTQMDSIANAYSDGPRSEEDAPGFDKAFERLKDDPEVDALADEFIKSLERFLNQANEELSGRICKELETIIAALRRRKSYSLYELKTWIDLAVKGVLVWIEQHSSLHGLAIGAEAVKAGYRVVQSLAQKYRQAEADLAETAKLRTLKDTAELPMLSPEQAEQKLAELGFSISPGTLSLPAPDKETPAPSSENPEKRA